MVMSNKIKAINNSKLLITNNLYLIGISNSTIYTIKLNLANLKSHYETLNIPHDATKKEIKKAYFKLSKIYHPDIVSKESEDHERFKEISYAYDVLSNDSKKKIYDLKLNKHGKLDQNQGMQTGQQLKSYASINRKSLDKWTYRQSSVRFSESIEQKAEAREKQESQVSYGNKSHKDSSLHYVLFIMGIGLIASFAYVR